MRRMQWAILASCLIAHGAWAQAYPTKLVRLVVGAPPGSMPATVPRMLTEKLASFLGQQVIIDSRPGSAGLTSAQVTSLNTALEGGYLTSIGANA
mgnify:CR=1 FL=1